MSGDDPWMLLKRLVDSSNDLAVTTARRMGIGLSDLRAVDHLLEHGATGPNGLGRRLGLTAPAATALADRLERSGHAERVRDEHDRRRVALVPTDHARRDTFAALGPFIEDMQELASSLPDRDRRAVVRFLERAIELNRRHAAER